MASGIGNSTPPYIPPQIQQEKQKEGDPVARGCWFGCFSGNEVQGNGTELCSDIKADLWNRVVKGAEEIEALNAKLAKEKGQKGTLNITYIHTNHVDDAEYSAILCRNFFTFPCSTIWKVIDWLTGYSKNKKE
jgi:hypothetical protein